MHQHTCSACHKPLIKCRGRQNGLGGVIRQLRKDAWLSQLNLGERSNIKISTISKIECGEKRPTLDQIVAIANVLNITPFLIIGRSIDKLIDRLSSNVAA